jgi:hypothetical protein
MPIIGMELTNASLEDVFLTVTRERNEKTEKKRGARK